MKYIKIYEENFTEKGKFSKGDYVVLKKSPDEIHKVADIQTPHENMSAGIGNFFSYKVREKSFHYSVYRESELRKATKKELEFLATAQKYNL